MLGEECLPHIGLKLLDPKREAAVFRLYAENNSLHLFTLLQNFRGMLDALGPAQVRNVYQTIDAVFDLDERSEVGQVAHAAFNVGACRVALHQMLPRILEKL